MPSVDPPDPDEPSLDDPELDESELELDDELLPPPPGRGPLYELWN